ncbi:DUF262 domain-containing protein [Vibrio parahaemolyticus]|uniref:DUF262 domain-containing protein n=1 Tax=Vibrio parahaemolyticus TaxID=670 RepID=UPI001122BAD0|nr:DUF262 domain-containing protein [Vibrio parahaemolyticus]MBM5020773.1 DUF262 domain-containing protein [Vibrio parahaemolyticus]MDF4587332.1 DUF262 domain-containing protein [Vibrio parahaemolyticus]MDF4713675.1 DUF262 domain-containing protein [Vibrio parahaemolyticus]TOH92544.1 hypothetical protein CGI71_02690 [Vibrio parahaemolyticus]TOL03238.1 hypothetical protein CGI09_15305 [Vibrio parahaemolyticus]
MAYASLSISDLIGEINKNKYYLPAIQRKFVWREEKICTLFDSIMRDYPIGTFLFWELDQGNANAYTFYEFLKNYHERDSKNALVNYSFPHDITGVLDGQQRISSMYIALQGIYQSRPKYAKRAKDSSYPKREFYLNLLGDADEYEFCFLTEQQAGESSTDRYYFRVRDILEYTVDDDPYDILDPLLAQNDDGAAHLNAKRSLARRKLDLLKRKIYQPDLISYFKVTGKELDEILDIFVRVNSGGNVLSKSDLLFSTLVAHWENGREQIEELLDELNGEDGLFGFNTDFLMRTCLFLVDAPMSFKVRSFNKETIEVIKHRWTDISQALKRTAVMLRDFGFNKKRLSSHYAATPIAYYLLKGGVVNQEIKGQLHKLVIHSLLKQVYSGQADTALNGLREGLRQKGDEGYLLKSNMFDFGKFKHTRLAGGKKLTIDHDDIDELLERSKGAFTFMVLSLLYPDLKLDKVNFHQDHMHPASGFKWTKLESMGLEEEAIRDWQSKRDLLPNLQLLEGQENVEKQAKALNKWVAEEVTNEPLYRDQNYIPTALSLQFDDFEAFFDCRRALMKTKLCKLFDVEQPNMAEFVSETEEIIDPV